MKYYQIALPVNIEKKFVYKSSSPLKKGCRVLISFGNTMKTGIVWKEVETEDKYERYKNILEIIDKKPIIKEDLQYLAEWLSKYYGCSIGSALFAMLPSGINIHLQQKAIRKKIERENFLENLNKTAKIILEELSFLEEKNIEEIKNKVKISDFYYWLEYLEDVKLIEIKRQYDSKIKNKIANFVIINRLKEMPKLTEKQNEAYKEILKSGKEFPLAKIAKKFNYSVIRALEQKNILRIEPREISSDEIKVENKVSQKKITLTEQQKTAVASVKKEINKYLFRAFLLYGITGSGKTEVYIEIIRYVLKKNRTALMLVPEISLTPQMVQRFYNAFGEDIAILHSHLNERERWKQWKKIKSGECKIVIGARSAIFAPLENIGVIIVDEEHESSYKQENTPRYNGRDLAIVRAKINNAVVILGSATPSLESWQNVIRGKYDLLKLENRPFDFRLPSVTIVDLKKEENSKSVLSDLLKNKIEDRLSKKEQIILFQNRRGHSSFVQCVSCGKLFKCPHCEISLNYHSRGNRLVCHYCGHTIDFPRKCPDCGHYIFNFGAPGTQQVEKQLKILFPTAKILRMDSDSATKKDSYKNMFERMQAGNVDILLGTQMISKGLDFPNVTLVGVISADVGLNFPDFRAAEKTFQLLTQVAGRSGRGKKEGEVIIQTYNPSHYAIMTAMKQDFPTFAETELSLRKKLNYPPYSKIIRIMFIHKNLKTLRDQLEKNRRIFQKTFSLFRGENLSILGPTPTPLIKLNNNYRFHLILKGKKTTTLFQALEFIRENIRILSTVKVVVDVDPLSLM
ncbi:MAG: primosomal protein N' [Candidatus Cloacimonadota bacterium]|nr:MAG: primosomal protein N' [Candidatus Cloacimonadota bacterium]